MSVKAVGVDLRERGALIVAVDGQGRIVKRAKGSGKDPLSKAAEAAGAGRVSVGIATDGDAADIGKGFKGAQPVVCSPGAALVSAETWTGAAVGARNVICLWVGERVFAGVMLDGRPWTGAHGHAGSAAWLALNPVERQDYRRHGSLAAEVSHAGIARRLSWRIQSGDHSSALERAGTIESITAEHVFEAARAGDGVAISIARETAKYIGMAIANLVATVDPEVVVLAGEIAEAGDLLHEPIIQECSRRLPPSLSPTLAVKLSPLGADGVALGAARLASPA